MTVNRPVGCKRIAGAKADGRDPAAERQAIRREHTLGSLFTYWLDTHAKRPQADVAGR